MITIAGEEGTSEHAVAKEIAQALESIWKGVTLSPPEQEHIRIHANAKLSGQKVSDFDVILCGQLRKGRRFIPLRNINGRNGESIQDQPISVESFLIAIEVKDQDPRRVRFEGEAIYVHYKEGWSSASDQNIKQVHALKSYFDMQHVTCWVGRLIVLRGLDTVSVPCALPRSFDGKRLLTEIASSSSPSKSGSEWVIRSFSNELSNKVLSASVFWTVQPSQLDRKRMDRILRRQVERADWLPDVGNKLLIFRGRGGAGKTVLLLQAAYKAYDENGLRSVFLTYNRALTADVTRIMALLNIPATLERGGVAVRTVMSFLLTWFHHLGLVDVDDDNLLKKYVEMCNQAIHMINSGAITGADIKELKVRHPDALDFDHVVVDEGQDWPQAEVDVLKALYSPERMIVADGVDQLVRGLRPDWGRGVDLEKRRTVKLDRCLRMKENLARFANAVAEEAAMDWRVEPSNEAGGGRVILMEQPYSFSANLHAELVKDARGAGNAPIDFLVCVPSSDMSMVDGKISSRMAQHILQSGNSVWDATDPEIRKDFPRDANSFRVVQYASCRGLEGWVVIANALDDLWEQQRLIGLQEEDKGGFKSVEELAVDRAWHWSLIPLTRPIDTLVITLKDSGSEFSQAVKKAASRCPDAVEWITTR